jgi:hypothetical protein
LSAVFLHHEVGGWCGEQYGLEDGAQKRDDEREREIKEE